MTIDEAIAEQRDNAKTQREIAEECFEEHIFDEKERVEHHKYADEFEQLAKWLEELKDHRERECNHINEALYDKGYSDGYNKAVEDFAKWLVEHKIVDEDSMPEIIIDFNEEQLKEGERE